MCPPAAEQPSTRAIWLLCLAPPLLFFLIVVGASIAIGARSGGDPEAIERKVTDATATLLVILQVLMAGLIALYLRACAEPRPRLLRTTALKGIAGQALAVGAAVGLTLGLLYVGTLAGVMESLQRSLGDYVPPGSVLNTLGALRVPFLIANVLLAPAVEETLYRGIIQPQLTSRFGPWKGLIFTCAAFGLLHWAGGVWYIVLTGVVAGDAFGALRLIRYGLPGSFCAHLAVNVVESIAVLS